MTKKLLTFLTLLTLFFGVGWAADGFVTLQYSGSETTNMTGNNDATLLGLDENSWSVVGDKGSSQYYPGLNKSKYIALYYAAQGSNTLTVSSLNGATIEDIKISYTGNSYKNSSVFVNGTKITEKSSGDYWKEYAINNSSFVVGNANTSNTQVRITSIIIYYSSSGTQPTTYNVNLNQSTGGTISANPTTAAAGTTVTLTATPDAGYEFTSWEVLDGDANEITVTNN